MTRVDGRAGGRAAVDDAPPLRDAIAEMIGACARYADAYASLRRQPVGCDVVRGPILLDVLRGISALAASDDQREQVRELVGDHALDLEE